MAMVMAIWNLTKMLNFCDIAFQLVGRFSSLQEGFPSFQRLMNHSTVWYGQGCRLVLPKLMYSTSSEVLCTDHSCPQKNVWLFQKTYILINVNLKSFCSSSANHHVCLKFQVLSCEMVKKNDILRWTCIFFQERNGALLPRKHNLDM